MGGKFKKLYYVDKRLYTHISIQFFKNKWQKITLFHKNSAIPFDLVTAVFRIHKGSLFRYLIGNKFLIGYKLGQFCFTRKPFNFIKKNKQKR